MKKTGKMLAAIKKRKRVSRTVARDEHGRFIAQETVEYYDDEDSSDYHSETES